MDLVKRIIARRAQEIITADMHIAMDSMGQSASFISEHGEAEAIEVQAVSPLVTQVKVKFKNRPSRYFVVKVSETL